MLRKIAIWLPPILASVFLILAFPSFNIELLAWIGLVPLFFSLDGKKPLKAFTISYVTGALFFLGTMYWLMHVTLPGMIAVALYLALYVGIFGLIASYAIGKPSYVSLFIIPAIWVALEYARSHLLGGFGWNLLAYSQSFNPLMIQTADIFGAYGVSFLIVLVNTAIFFTIKDIKNKNYSTFHLAIAIVLLFLSAAYGTLRINNIFTGEPLKVAVVQGNIAQLKKWDPEFRKMILDKYEALTIGAAKENPDITVWPETAVPGFLTAERDLFDRVSGLAVRSESSLLVGAPKYEPGDKDIYYNSAVLFDKDGKVSGSYNKLHLVPFGEFIPARGIFSFVEKFTKSTIGDFSPGKEYTVFKFFVEHAVQQKDSNWRLLKKARFSVLICFEDVFPDLARQFVLHGAGFLVNMTNDAWFGNTCAPYQHLQASIFRAVENRVNVIRSANTGVSCFIDQKGRVVGTVESGGKEIFVDGFRAENIILSRTRTFYTVHGDLLTYLCMILTAAYLAVSLLRKL